MAERKQRVKSQQLWRWGGEIYQRLKDPEDSTASYYVALLVLLIEICLCTFIVHKIPYTKIDWDAYMSQVDGFLNGERNYSKLEGDTGPLVYPAGFLYAFAGLQKLTGGQVPPAQVIFGLLYVVNQAIVLLIYIRSKVVPPWALLLLCASKRVHSIFVLRLFNDCIAMALLYAAVALLQTSTWNLGLVVFSAAVSVKMNVLLFAPPIQVLLLKGSKVAGIIVALLCAAAVQVGLGLPFLLQYPWEYLANAFNLGRVFVHFWSVNFKFVPEHVFVSKRFSVALLVIHLVLLLAFATRRWCRFEGGLWCTIMAAIKQGPKSSSASMARSGRKARFLKGKPVPVEVIGKHPLVSAEHVATLVFTGNFIGICCARSLHYQFYSWYFHTLPYLLWRTNFPTPLRLAIFAVVEVCWNIYPSTSVSSAVLLFCHLSLLAGLWWAPEDVVYPVLASDADHANKTS